MDLKRSVWSGVFFIMCLGLFAQEQFDYMAQRQILEQSHFIDNVEIRKKLRHYLTAGTPQEIVDDKGQPISVQTYPMQNIDQSAQLTVLLPPDDPEVFLVLLQNETGLTGVDRYSFHGRGSYVLRKSLITGEFLQVKIFVQNDVNSFIRLVPNGNTAMMMDIYLYGVPVYRNVLVPLSLDIAISAPLARLMSLSQQSIDWASVFPPLYYDQWRAIGWMGNQIRLQLPRLFAGDIEDGAQDAKGRFVYIKNLEPQSGMGGFNCSGFTKWVIDGLYRALTGGKMTDITALKKQPTQRTNANQYIQHRYPERDPYFGLDWIRNLAWYAEQSRFPDKPLVNITRNDVSDVAFLPFVPDVGYPLSSLEAVLYEQAGKNPGVFYLGAVSVEFGTNPSMRQYIHDLVLMPRFDKNGQFVINMFERNTETTPEILRQRYPGGYIFLTKVQGSRQFDLPALG